MPGSKRRSLKKLLSPIQSPAGGNGDSLPTSTHSSTPDVGSPSETSSLAPLPATTATAPVSVPPHNAHSKTGDGVSPPPAGESDVSTKKQHHSLHSPFHLFHHHKHSKGDKESSPNALRPQSSTQSAQSGTSIASNPNNYSSDQELREDLELETMTERQDSIGSEGHRQTDGVGDLSGLSLNEQVSSTSPNRSRSILASTSHMPGGVNGQPGVVSPDHRPPPGGMYGARQAMTAEGLIYGAEDGKKKKKGSKQRFAERQARRKEAILNSAPPSDPAWTEQLERERQTEIKVITDACNILDRYLYEIPPDGHCMYNAISDQLLELGLLKPHHSNAVYVRRAAANYLRANRDSFIAFLPSVNGEDTQGAVDHDGIMTPAEFNQYCHNVEETGEWGGEPEIQALSRAFEVPIHVFQAGPPTVVSHGGQEDGFGGATTAEKSKAAGDRVVRITYHRRMYGLGEHYNSLRKNGT